MRIGIEAQRLLRPHKHGMEITALETIRALVNCPQHEYVVFVRPDCAREGLPKAPNVQIVELSGGPYPVWEQYVLPKAITKYGIDLLHCTANTAPLRCPVPRVLTLHDMIYLEEQLLTGGSWYQRLGNLYRRWNVPRIVADCERIVTVSHFERQRIIKFLNLDPSRVSTVHNGVSARFRVIDDPERLAAVRQKYDLPRNFAFFMGNANPRKNTWGFLSALKQLRQRGRLELPVVISSMTAVELGTLLAELGVPELSQDIRLCGYVSAEDLPLVYNAASIFCYPSLREGFGLPILEAMACGTPVLTSDTTSMPEVAGDAALLIDPSSPANIAFQLSRLMTQQKLRTELRHRGLQRAALFSWQHTANQLVKTYEQVIRPNQSYQHDRPLLAQVT